MSKIVIIIGIILLALIAVRIFTLPLKLFFKLLISTLSGFICLVLVNLAGSLIGLAIDITLLNALIVGVLGLPGLVILLALQLIFML